MFDNYFGRFQTFLYDVSDTIARSASMLLSRGIRVEGGEKPCTDGKSVITLPQAMKRRLAADEIDFVRYLLHHEGAHIKHSDDPPHTVSELHFTIFNALEDVRIEKLERTAHAGSMGIFSRGHNITRRIWDERVERMDPDKVPIAMGVVNAIFGSFIEPERRDNKSGIPMLDWCMDQTREFFPKIDNIGKVQYLKTGDLADLAYEIYRKFKQGIRDEESKGEKSQGEDQVLSESAVKEALQAQQGYVDHPELFGGGMVEQAAAEIMAQGGGEETVNFKEIEERSKSHAFGTSSAYFKDATPRDASKHWEWGRRAAAGAGPIIKLLRGQSRHALSTPKDSGIRIHQRSVPDFINGLTNAVLRRRKITPKIGTSVLLMVDDSGSMEGYYDKDAWRAASMLGHACERAQIKCAVARFSNQVVIEKQFSQSMASVRKRLGPFMGNGTNAYPALDTAHMQLQIQKTARKVCFFICDGSTPDCRGKLRNMYRDGIEVYPILLGAGAAQQAQPGCIWDVPGVAKIIDTRKHLASSLVSRLVSVCK